MADKLKIHRSIPLIFFAELLHTVSDMTDPKRNSMIDHLNRNRFCRREKRDFLRLAPRGNRRLLHFKADPFQVFFDVAESLFQLI